MRSATERDPELRTLRQFIKSGFPSSKRELPENIRQFWPKHADLTEEDGVILCGCRLVIPRSMRKAVTALLHDSHQGQERTKARARRVVYWPGLDRDVDAVTNSCETCQRVLPSHQQETYRSHARPERPFQILSADFLQYAGRHFLVTVDHLSGWPTIAELGTDTSARKLINTMQSLFCFTGAPDVFYSDGGPQLTSGAFQAFLRRWGVEHRTSSPGYAQSNGRAEAAVKSMKKLIAHCWCPRSRTLLQEEWTRGILQYRNTPGANGLSPAQVVFGRPVQDAVPAHRRAFAQKWQAASDAADRVPPQIIERYNRAARDLQTLAVGNHVAIQDFSTRQWSRYGVITAVNPNRQYLIRMSSGRVLCRNRRFIRRRYAHATADPTVGASTQLPTRPPPSPRTTRTTVPGSTPRSIAAGENVTTPPIPPRRSRRIPRPPQRLIEAM